MQKRLDELDRLLAAGLAPLYVIHGDEMLLALEAADAIRAAARAAGHLEREVLTVEVISTGHSSPQQRQQLAVCRQEAAGNPPAVRQARYRGAEALVRLAARLPDDTVTLVLLPRLDKTQQASK